MVSELHIRAGRVRRDAAKWLKWTVDKIVLCLRVSGKLFLAFATEERCRICNKYIDMLDWLNEFVPGEVASPAYLEGSARSMAICDSCWKELLLSRSILSRFAVDNPDVLVMNDYATDFSNVRKLVVHSGIGYTEQMKKLVRKFKYDKDLLLTQPLSCLVIKAWQPESDKPDNLILVPVPLHWRRKRQRGYNQAALLAETVGKRLSIPVYEKALSRKKFTKPQNKLTKDARHENLTSAFRGDEKLLRGMNVVLVDDVCTSGATLLECAREAYQCGANSVSAVTVARAILVHTKGNQRDETTIA
jgi:ComF family protein